MSRIDFYKKYYEDLTPSTLYVSKNENKILISGFENQNKNNFMQSFEKGGQTNFNPDGAIKGKIVHASGEAGGMLVGKRHSNGGIKAINKSTGQPIEMEGGEVVITRNAVSDNTKRSFNGKMMTNRQILSAINESGGGVSFANGGQVPNNVAFDCNAEYEYGGKTMCGKDLAYAMGGRIQCGSCDWSWNRKDGGDDMYVCHKCGTDNSKSYAKGGAVDDDFSELTSAVQQLNDFYEQGGKVDAVARISDIKDVPIPFYSFLDEYGNKQVLYYKQTQDGQAVFKTPYLDDFLIFSDYPTIVKKINGTSIGATDVEVLDLIDFSTQKFTDSEFDRLRDFYQKFVLENYGITNIQDPNLRKLKLGSKKLSLDLNKISGNERYGGVSLYFRLEKEPDDYKLILDNVKLNSVFNPSAPIPESLSFEIRDRYNDIVYFNYTQVYSLNELIELISSDMVQQLISEKSYNRRITMNFKFNFKEKNEFTESLSKIFKITANKTKPRTGWKLSYQFGYKAFKSDPIHVVRVLTNVFWDDVTSIPRACLLNLYPFLLGTSSFALKRSADKKEEEKIRKATEKKEKEERELRASYLADLEKTEFFNEINNKTTFTQQLKDKEDLTKLLSSFKGVKFANQRAKIIRELGKIDKSVYETTTELKSAEDKLFRSEGLLDYYFTQTTQSPVQDLGKASKMPTPNGLESKLPFGTYLNVRSLPFKNWFGDWETAFDTNNYTDTSILIDEETKEPRLFYHGVRRFRKGMKGGAMGSGITRPFGSFTPSKFPASYFSDKKSYAEFYSGQSENLPKEVRSNGFIYPVFLNVKNPLDLRPLGFESTYKDFIDYIRVVTGIKMQQSKNVVQMTQKNVDGKFPVWSFIRNDVQVIESLKDYGYDGIIQIGDIPRYDKNGNLIKDRTRWTQEDEYLTFYPNQVKSAVAKKSFFLPMFDDIRFKKGGYVSI